MLCKNPFVRNPDPNSPKKFVLLKKLGARGLGKEVFPCGQCLHCRINKRRNWTNRMRLELLDHGKASFVTLTYSEDCLPAGGTLVPEDVTKFFKRLRSAFQYEDEQRADACLLPRFRRIRYYYCGEYGEHGGRPHYHIALFGVCQTETDLLEKCWHNGHIYTGELNKNSIQYVAGYILKGMNHDRSEINSEFLKGRHPEFQRMSRNPGLGTNAVIRIAKKSQTDERFRAIRQGPSKIHFDRVLQHKVDDILDYDDDGSEFNDYCLKLYREFHRDYEDYKNGLVEGRADQRRIAEKRLKLRNRRKKL